jgi:very-short-patch-repair endonuclease
MSLDFIATVQRLGARRFGVVTTTDLIDIGASKRQIAGLVRSGVLERVHRSVYRLRGAPPTLEQRALAACLAAGRGSVACGSTAGQLWRIIAPADGPIYVTVPARRRSTHEGIVVRRRELGPRDVTRIGLVPITRVPRTIADLDKRLRAPAVDEALGRGLVRADQLLGFDLHLDVLAMDRMERGIPESELERRMIALLKRHRLPAPVRQHVVGSFRVDLAYPERRVAIELDGHAYHSGRDRWEADLARQNAITLDGWQVLRFTWWDVTVRPDATVEQVRRALSGAR